MADVTPTADQPPVAAEPVAAAQAPGAPVADQGPESPAVTPLATTDSVTVHEDDRVRVDKVGQRFDWFDKTGNAQGPSPDAGTPGVRAIVAADAGGVARHQTDEEAAAASEAAKDSTVK